MYQTQFIFKSLTRPNSGLIMCLSGRTIARAAGIKSDEQGRVTGDKFEAAGLPMSVACHSCNHSMSLFAAFVERVTMRCFCKDCK